MFWWYWHSTDICSWSELYTICTAFSRDLVLIFYLFAMLVLSVIQPSTTTRPSNKFCYYLLSFGCDKRTHCPPLYSSPYGFLHGQSQALDIQCKACWNPLWMRQQNNSEIHMNTHIFKFAFGYTVDSCIVTV